MAIEQMTKEALQEDENLVYFRMFGPFQVENKYGIVEEKPNLTSVPWMLLKYMLFNIYCSRGHLSDMLSDTQCVRVHMDELIDVLWKASEKQTETSVNRTRVRRLREALIPLHLDNVETGLVRFKYEQFSFNPKYTLILDDCLFNAHIMKIVEWPMDDASVLQSCSEALEIYRGTYLMSSSELAWLKPDQDHYQKLFEVLVRNTLERTKITGDKRCLPLLCKRVVDLAPDWEEFHRDLVRYLVEQKEDKLLMQYIYNLSHSRETGPDWLINI